MEQELYYLIAKFLANGPCKNAARVLQNELKEHCELLPNTITYEGKQVPMTMDRLSKEYPNIDNNYLLELLGKFLNHFRETGDPTVLRVSALRHGDNSLLTMLSAFVPHKEVERCNYLTMTSVQLDKLSIHRMLIAREMNAEIMKKVQMPTSISTFYREHVTISGHRNPVYSVVFDKTNRRLFTGSDDFLVKVWCVRTGHLIHTIRGHQNVITDIAINQENTLIATASSDGTVRVWTMDEYKPIMCLRPNSNTVKPFTTVKFSPSPRADTRYLMATNEDGFVRLWRWDRETLQFFDIDSPITFSCRFRARDRLRCSSFNYTGTKFSVAGDDGFIYVFSTLQIQTTHEGSSSLHGHIDYSSQERPAVRGRKRFANALFPDKNNPVQTQGVVPIGTLEGHMGSVTDLAFSHDGQRILSGCQDGTARIWAFDKDLKEWKSIVLDLKQPISDTTVIVKPSTPSSTVMSRATSVSLEHHYSKTQSLTDSDEFGSLMPPLEDNDAPPSNMDIDIVQETVPQSEPPKVSMIAWSADDRWCAVASNQGEIRVYYAFNGEPACVLKGHEGEIYALDSHPLDSNTILSAGYDGNVILWDVVKKKVINCTNHVGRTFTDCKFSKDGMKYAITDEEGHCTLFGIGGLDKDYEQVRSWERGQYFISDYQALRHYPDGSFVDEATQQEPYALPFSLIIDLQGVAYPNQNKLGYGRNIPITPETFEIEELKRSACYDQEEEEIRNIKLIILPALDRATIAKKRREFVRFDEDEDNDMAGTGNVQFQFPPPIFPILLPDDPADEDYHDDEAGNADYVSSAGSSDDEGGSDDFLARDDEAIPSDNEDEDEGPITRSRAGQLGSQSLYRPSTSRTSSSQARRGVTTRRRGRGRGRGGVGRTRGSTRSTRKRTRERSDEDDEEEQPVRARARRRVTEIPSYVESDLESEEEEEEEEEVEFVDVEEDESDGQHSDYSEAGPSNRQRNQKIDTNSTSSSRRPNSSLSESAFDRKGKRKLRSSSTTAALAHNIEDDDDDDDFVNPSSQQFSYYQNNNNNSGISSSSRSSHDLATGSSSAPVGRATRSRAKQQDAAPAPKSLTTTTKPSSAAKTSHKRHGKQRDGPRILTEEEIKVYEPIPWITKTDRSLSKYLPQLGDTVAILTEGHKQYLRASNMKQFFDEKHGVIDKHRPVLFAKVVNILWQVGPPTYCKLKVTMLQLSNLQQVLAQQEEPYWTSSNQDEIIEYSDEDGCPEFIILWERFIASMDIFQSLQVGQKVSAMYDDAVQYTGTISHLNQQGLIWRQANLASPWAYFHVIWDDTTSTPEDLCPWELVPFEEDFRSRYDIQPSLTAEQIKRAKEILKWLSNIDDFMLYVHQVNYYDYPAYLSIIAYPICLDMVQERLDNNFYRSVDGLIDDVELIKKNAMRYNAESSAAHKNAVRLSHFFKTRILKPSMPLALTRGGGRKRVIADESDDEYTNDEAQRYEESDEEPIRSKKSSRNSWTYSDEEDNFVVAEDDDEDEDYE
ncbi:MAG: hypothetical protein EXX96DRAFT_529467 [Benjaminiella poitrasii]|nr:MAG: hypothetical protein EXX96DRAFT_529467 [Benjaminiella poitrasii]